MDDIGIRSPGKKNNIKSSKTNRLIWICIYFHLLFPITFQFANQWPSADQRWLFTSISVQVYGQRDFCIIAGGCRTWCRHGGHKGMGGIVVMKFILVTDHLRQGGCLQKRWIGHFSHEKGTTSSLIHILKMGGSTITRFRLVISSSSLMTWPSHAAFWSRSWWEDGPLLGWQADDELLLLDVVIQNHVRIMPGV